MQWQRRIREILPLGKKYMDAPILRHFLRKIETRENYEIFPKRCRGGLRRAGQYFDRPERWIGYRPPPPPPLSPLHTRPPLARAVSRFELSQKVCFKNQPLSMWPSNVLFIRKFICSTLFLAFVAVCTPSEFAPRRRPVGSRSLAIGQVSCGRRRRLPILVPHPSLPPKSSKKAQESSSEKILR